MTLKTLHITVDESLYNKINEHRMFGDLPNIVSRLLESYIQNMPEETQRVRRK